MNQTKSGIVGRLMLWLAVLAGLLGGGSALAETITYFHNDIAGTPIAASDASGNVIWKENYQPFGGRMNNLPASGSNDQWFAGKPVETATGLSYFGARYYDPALGRFMGIDPKEVDPGNLHSFNRYSYGNNNPYRYVDLDGRESQPVFDEVEDYKLRREVFAGNTQMVPEAGTWTLERAWEALKEVAIAKGSGIVLGVGAKTRTAEKVVTGLRSLASPVYKTTKEATQAAEKLGFKRIKETVHEGEAVFQKGKYFITRDRDGHAGGAWKMARSVEALGSKETRMGTYDTSLQRIGD